MSKLLHSIYRELNDVANNKEYELNSIDACHYYNTIKQHWGEFEEVDRECEEENFWLHYNPPIENDWYSSGSITICGLELEHDYEIKLEYDERHYRYCQCSPSDEGYNVEHGCCGNGCDATFPSVTLLKITSKRLPFQGVMNDLWALEAEWNGTLKEDYQERVRRENLQRLEEEIHRLLDARNKLLNEGNNKE